MGRAATTNASSDPHYILLTDIYQSSRLSELYPRQYASVLDIHNAAVEEAVRECAGQVYKNTGDGYIAFFDSAHDCIACATSLATEFAKFPDFAKDDPFLVRITAHQGKVRPAGTEYYGPALNRASRLCQVCNPGQIVFSDPAKPARRDLPEGTSITDLGEHHLRDLAKPEHLYQLNVPGLPQEFPALPTLGNRPNNLVEQPGAFIGRERELGELTGLLADLRLVSIIASGGYGKSRLSAQLCANLLDSFERGVFFVELAPLRDHTGITTALANATGFQFYGTRDPKEQLIDFLREKELLLCFDNFEHVLEGASFIADILKEAPRVKAIVTSREPLRIRGEQVYKLQPLPVADEHSDAVMLFSDRASLVNSGFALDVPLVQGICILLSGIPLAIELAAAWMDSYTLPELRDELGKQLELTARMSDTPERHRSLRASLDWSWNLLDEQHRKMLMAMSTFRGGCFADGASAVLQTEGMKLRGGLAKLLDKSWLYTRELDGRTRWYMRDAASREYAFEKLEGTRDRGQDASPDGSADVSSAEQAGGTPTLPTSLYESSVMAHARYYSGRVEAEGPRLHGYGQLEALQMIGLEKQNIYEAMDTLLRRLESSPLESPPLNLEPPSLLLPIVRWSWEFLDMTDACLELVERYQVLKEAAGHAGSLEQIRLWALLGYCKGQWRLSDLDAARDNANEANALAETLGNHYGQALSLNVMGVVESDQGNYDAARELNNESLAIMREVKDRHGIAMSLNEMGIVECKQGDYDAAKELFNESLAIRREIGYRSGIASSLVGLGIAQYSQGNYDAARELYGESLAIYREIGNRSGIAACLSNLGIVESDQGNYAAARRLYSETLTIKREIGDRYGIAACLSNMGLVESNQGNNDAARELHSESLAIRRAIGYRSGIAISLNNLGIVEHSQGNHDAARELYSESLAIKREIGDRRGVAMSLYSLGNVEHSQGNHDAAREMYNESLAIRREIGDRRGIAMSLLNLGNVEYNQSNYDAARELHNEALAISREIGSRSGIAMSLHNLGLVEYRQGNYDAAREQYAESLAVEREIGDSSGICESTAAIGCLLATVAEVRASAICLHGARYHATQNGFTFDPMERELLEQGLAFIEHPETGLPTAERERLKAQAESMSLDELAEYALDALGKLALE